MRHLVLFLALLFFSGCVTQITDMNGVLRNEDFANPNNKTLDSILKTYFTDEAYEVLKDIPLYDGPIFGGVAYAAGTTFLSSVPPFFYGIFGRAVIMRRSCLCTNWGIANIIHEYIHHLDEMTLEGVANFIDRDEFEAAYIELANNQRYAGIPLFVEQYANKWFTNTFGISQYSEYIAYVGQVIYNRSCTPRMRAVYSKILREPKGVVDSR